MPIRITIIALLILFNQGLFGQTFLRDYEKYRIDKLDSIKETRKGQGLKPSANYIKQYRLSLNQQIRQFDSVFSFHKEQNRYDFNTADSLIIIFQTGIENNLSDYIIFNGTDTISYAETFLELKPQKYIKRIVYTPFLDTTQRKGLIRSDDRDSLIILASKREFPTAIRLAKDHPVLDGASTTIIFAKKEKGRYLIDDCFLQPFGLLPIWRKK